LMPVYALLRSVRGRRMMSSSTLFITVAVPPIRSCAI
jgi:hypothetical protein